jgi:hypothetical protein
MAGFFSHNPAAAARDWLATRRGQTNQQNNHAWPVMMNAVNKSTPATHAQNQFNRSIACLRMYTYINANSPIPDC